MNFKIRKFKTSDTRETAMLISKTFAKFGKKNATKEGVKWYSDMYNPSKNDIGNIGKIFARTKIFFVATAKNKIVGMIRGGKGKIINLYVDGKYHKHGIGRALVEKFEKECIKQKINTIKVSGFLYAVSFYQKVGCKKTTGKRNKRGIQFFPMKKNLN